MVFLFLVVFFFLRLTGCAAWDAGRRLVAGRPVCAGASGCNRVICQSLLRDCALTSTPATHLLSPPPLFTQKIPVFRNLVRSLAVTNHSLPYFVPLDVLETQVLSMVRFPLCSLHLDY